MPPVVTPLSVCKSCEYCCQVTSTVLYARANIEATRRAVEAAGLRDQSDDRQRINGSRNSIYRVIISARGVPRPRERNLLQPRRRPTVRPPPSRRGSTLTGRLYSRFAPRRSPSSRSFSCVHSVVASRQKISIHPAIQCIDIGSSSGVYRSCEVRQLRQILREIVAVHGQPN